MRLPIKMALLLIAVCGARSSDAQPIRVLAVNGFGATLSHAFDQMIRIPYVLGQSSSSVVIELVIAGIPAQLNNQITGSTLAQRHKKKKTKETKKRVRFIF